MPGSATSSGPEYLIASEPWLDRHTFNESEMALFFGCMLLCVQNLLDTVDIFRLNYR